MLEFSSYRTVVEGIAGPNGDSIYADARRECRGDATWKSIVGRVDTTKMY